LATPTTEQVKAVITTPKTDLSAQIGVADNLVDEELANVGLSETRLTNIKIYLSAHFVAVDERQPIEDEVGETRVEFDENRRDGLRSSTYGQTAIALDTSGTLSGLGLPKGRVLDVNNY